ncbi:MAG TPA: hypothetical protein VHW26_05305 [Solirubrobacteraceae bacterium]|nr:hypothetical protein [Solirubrobacteraceae bacterium]
MTPAEVRPARKPVGRQHRRATLPFAAGLFVSGVVIAAIVILLTGSSPSNAPVAPPPAKLPALGQRFTDKALGVTGYVARDWIVGGAHGILRLGSTDGKAIIAVVAPGAASTAKDALTTALGVIRKSYKHVRVKQAPGSSLGGLPAQSVVVYARTAHGVSVRILLASARGRRYAYALQASTAKNAPLRLLEETQETIATLRFSK